MLTGSSELRFCKDYEILEIPGLYNDLYHLSHEKFMLHLQRAHHASSNLEQFHFLSVYTYIAIY